MTIRFSKVTMAKHTTGMQMHVGIHVASRTMWRNAKNCSNCCQGATQIRLSLYFASVMHVEMKGLSAHTLSSSAL